MSDLVNKVAEILNAPVDLVQRSAEARAAASGVSVDDVLSSWAGGESVAASAPKEEAPVVEEAPVEEVVEEAPVEEVVEEVIEEITTEEVVEEVIEEIVEMKNESSLSFISGVLLVSIFTYLFAFAIPKNQATNLVSDSLNNSVNSTSEVIEGAEI